MMVSGGQATQRAETKATQTLFVTLENAAKFTKLSARTYGELLPKTPTKDAMTSLTPRLQDTVHAIQPPTHLALPVTFYVASCNVKTAETLPL